LRDSELIPLSWGQFLRGYFSLILGLIALAILLERWAGIDAYRTAVVAGGILFCLAALRRPTRLYLVVRNTGWFALVRHEPAGLWLPPAQWHR
jgi:hypothetical protein